MILYIRRSYAPLDNAFIMEVCNNINQLRNHFGNLLMDNTELLLKESLHDFSRFFQYEKPFSLTAPRSLQPQLICDSRTA